MVYEWDEGKNALNIAKHGLDFTDAWRAIEDPRRITFADGRKDYGEERLVTIGRVEEEIVAVACHTDRSGAVRIISLRKASKKERGVYYGKSQSGF